MRTKQRYAVCMLSTAHGQMGAGYSRYTSRVTHGYFKGYSRVLKGGQEIYRLAPTHPPVWTAPGDVKDSRRVCSARRQCRTNAVPEGGDAPHCRRAHGWCSSRKTCSGHTPPTVTRERCAYSARTWGSPDLRECSSCLPPEPHADEWRQLEPRLRANNFERCRQLRNTHRAEQLRRRTSHV
jgi:hypothetical protein